MPNCDLCGELKDERDLTSFSSTEMQKSIELGFNPFNEISKLKDSPSFKFAKSAGANDPTIFFNWKTMVLQGSSNWLICAYCSPFLKKALQGDYKSNLSPQKRKKVCRACGMEIDEDITFCPCGKNESFVQVIDEFNKPETSKLKSKAQSFAANGNYQKAIAKFKEALLINPSDPTLWSNIGALLLKPGSYSEGARYLKQALLIDPNLGAPQRMLDKIKLMEGIDIDSIKAISIDEVKENITKEIESKNGICFIATASYSETSKEVTILKNFRDFILLKNILGRLFIRFYYFSSPPIARWIKQSINRQKLSRILLSPFVRIAEYFIKNAKNN